LAGEFLVATGVQQYASLGSSFAGGFQNGFVGDEDLFFGHGISLMKTAQKM